MAKNFAGMPLREYGALLFRRSMVSMRPKKLAEELDVSEPYCHKMMEGERPPNLLQWLETLSITRDLNGVKQLVRDLGGVVVWKNGALAQVLRALAEDLGRQEAGGGR